MATTVINALDTGRDADAAALVFEYMAATLAEMGRPAPKGIGELPGALARECRSLEAVYRPPGALLIAEHDGAPAGCVGLAPRIPPDTAEVKRLYVRPAYRGKRIARILMNHAHEHAARHDLSRLILDVLPARANAIEFYRRLGYTDAEPFITESPVPMIYLERQ